MAVRITHFSDTLCVWAFLGHRRVEELIEQYGDDIEIETRYCSVFPDAWSKIVDKWGADDGFEAFGRHLHKVAADFPHISLHPDLWQTARPRSSSAPHLYLKAVQLIEDANLPWRARLSTRADWAMRRAFFEEARDISDWSVLDAVLEETGIDPEAVAKRIRSSEAVARLAADYHLCGQLGITGSPTLVLNEGRQTLFGNVGYRLIEANVQELLRSPASEDASWC